MCGQCGCEQGAPLTPEPTRIVLQRNLLERNEQQALHNRIHFERHGLLAVNLVSAPGSGKTAFLEQLARQWPRPPIGVIVGDLATDNDAQRLKSAGARSVQIQTGDLCHLEADLVARAFVQLETKGMDLLMIENVGNLVCPTAFALGEHLRIALISVTEGEDKPLKYPALFRSVDAVLINKIDLEEVVGFDRRAALANLRDTAPQAEVFAISARSGAGVEAVMAWLQDEQRN